MNAKYYRRFSLAIVASLVISVFLSYGRARESLPVHVVNQRTGWAKAKSCEACHIEADHFALTGHAQTMSPANSEASLELLSQLATFPVAVADNVRIEQRDDQVYAVHTYDGTSQEIRLDWCFGSGLHARTWLGVLGDSWGATDQVEFRWTWYHQLEGFDLTPGQPEKSLSGYFGHLGLLFDHPKTRRCFACHATRLPIDEGRVDYSQIIPGVQCQRCHGPQKEHVDTDGYVIEHSWSEIDHVESVNRCAQCHRRAEEMENEEIVPENKFLARFQPIGLTHSACFNSEKMTCIICHDPHLPLGQQKLDGIWQCVQCHDGTPEKHGLCGAGQKKDCIGCHMPKVTGDVPVTFTDHWIRVRTDTAPGKTDGSKND